MKKYIFIAIISCISISALAQNQRGEKSINLWYTYALPLGDFKNNIAKSGSARSANVELLWSINPQLKLGVSGGFVNFYEKKPRAIYKTTDGSDISAVLTNNVQAIPVLITGVYAPMAADDGTVSGISPFVQLGVGAAMVQHEQLLGQFSNVNASKTQLAAKAGVGIKIPFGAIKQHGILAGVQYNYTGYKGLDMGVNSLNYLTGGVGLSFALFD